VFPQQADVITTGDLPMLTSEGLEPVDGGQTLNS
jgi:hypothetical protein